MENKCEITLVPLINVLDIRFSRVELITELSIVNDVINVTVVSISVDELVREEIWVLTDVLVDRIFSTDESMIVLLSVDEEIKETLSALMLDVVVGDTFKPFTVVMDEAFNEALVSLTSDDGLVRTTLRVLVDSIYPVVSSITMILGVNGVTEYTLVSMTSDVGISSELAVLLGMGDVA